MQIAQAAPAAQASVQAHGLTASSLRVDESAIRAAIALYTRESGVRSLERQLGKICRKAAMQLATSDVKRVTVTEKNIKDLLGAPRAAQDADYPKRRRSAW